MPSGRTHDRITLWSLPGIVLLSCLLTRSGELTLIVAGAFLFSGLMFGPDLDIYSVQYKRWGILRWIWLPYQTLLRHRSIFSHGLIIGTLLRSLYLFSLLALVSVLGIAVAQLIWGFAWNWQQFTHQAIQGISTDYWQEAIAAFVGLEMGGMSHSLSDWIGSAYKRQTQQRRRKASRQRK